MLFPCANDLRRTGMVLGRIARMRSVPLRCKLQKAKLFARLYKFAWV